MESLPDDKILKYNDDTLDAVRKLFSLDKPGVMKNAVDILEEWVKQQDHFTKKSFDRRYLEVTIILCKGSIERAKTRLDRACTLRTLNRNFFSICDVSYDYQNYLKHVRHGILPKLTKEHGRVYLLKNSGKHFDASLIARFIHTMPSYAEYIRRNDYAAHFSLIVDYSEVNLSDLLTKINVNDLQQVIAYLLDGCGFRLKALYFITPLKLIEMGIALIKPFISAKIAGRINVIKEKNSLKDIFDRDILPEEYGGTEKSLEKLHEEWLEVVTSEGHVEYMKEMNSAQTDEHYRRKDNFNEQYMGMPGTFRILSVD